VITDEFAVMFFNERLTIHVDICLFYTSAHPI